MNINFNVDMNDLEQFKKVISYIQNLDIKLPNYIPLLINIQDKNGMTFLTSASVSGNLEMLKYLIELGVNVDAKNGDSMTALMLATFFGRLNVVKYLAIVEYLVENKINPAKINIKNSNGDTALDIAISINGDNEPYKNIVNYLIKHGGLKGSEIK